MVQLTIGCVLHHSDRVAHLALLFQNLVRIDTKSGLDTERIVLVDDRNSDECRELASTFSEPKPFFFQDYSHPRNLIQRMAAGEWVFQADTDCIYDSDLVSQCMNRAMDFPGKKAVTAGVLIHSANEKSHPATLDLLLRPPVTFRGLAYGTPTYYPHEYVDFDLNVCDRYGSQSESESIIINELLHKEFLEIYNNPTDNVEGLYWRAIRLRRLVSVGFIQRDQADEVISFLLDRATTLNPRFGPAYYILAQHHFIHGRYDIAKAVAEIGYEASKYQECQDLLNEVLGKI